MKLKLLTIGLFCSCIVFAQKGKKYESNSGSQHIFYGELGGPGVIFSINLDSRFAKANTGFGGRVGLGFLTRREDVINNSTGYYSYGRQRSIVTVPVQLNYVFGKPNSSHLIEVGAGVTFFGKRLSIADYFNANYNSGEPESIATATASFMYRKIAKNGGFFWHGGFTPYFANGYIQPMVGAGIGYGF